MRSSKKVKRLLLLSLLFVPILLSGCVDQYTENEPTNSSSSSKLPSRLSSHKGSDSDLASKSNLSSSSSAESSSLTSKQSSSIEAAIDAVGVKSTAKPKSKLKSKSRSYHIGSQQYKNNTMTADQASNYEIHSDVKSSNLEDRLEKSGFFKSARDDNNIRDAIIDAHDVVTEYEYPHHKRITLNYILNNLTYIYSDKVINKLKRNPKLIFDNTTNAYINRCVKYGNSDGF